MSEHPVSTFRPPSPRQYPYHFKNSDPNSGNNSPWSQRPPYLPSSSQEQISHPVLYTTPHYPGREPTQYQYLQSPPPSSELRPLSQNGRNSYFQDQPVFHNYRPSNSPGTSYTLPPTINTVPPRSPNSFTNVIPQYVVNSIPPPESPFYSRSRNENKSRSPSYSQSQHHPLPYSPPNSPPMPPQESPPQTALQSRMRATSFPPQIHLEAPSRTSRSPSYPPSNGIQAMKSHENLMYGIQLLSGLNISRTSPSKEEQSALQMQRKPSTLMDRSADNSQSSNESNGHSPQANCSRSEPHITVTTWNWIKANFDGIHENARPLGVGGFAQVFEVYSLTSFLIFRYGTLKPKLYEGIPIPV